MQENNHWIKDRLFVLSYCPDNFSAKKKYPAVLFLHGAGTRGNDREVLKNNICLKKLKDHLKDCLIIAPQCPGTDWFEVMQDLLELTENVFANPSVDSERLFLTGVSMGGYGAWELAMLRPHFFAALSPLCGGGMVWNAERLKNVPVNAYHGALDPVVPMSESQRMVEAVNRYGGKATLKIYENLAHNCWEETYDSPQFYEWLLSQKRTCTDSKFHEISGSEIYG